MTSRNKFVLYFSTLYEYVFFLFVFQAVFYTMDGSVRTYAYIRTQIMFAANSRLILNFCSLLPLDEGASISRLSSLPRAFLLNFHSIISKTRLAVRFNIVFDTW